MEMASQSGEERRGEELSLTSEFGRLWSSTS